MPSVIAVMQDLSYFLQRFTLSEWFLMFWSIILSFWNSKRSQNNSKHSMDGWDVQGRFYWLVAGWKGGEPSRWLWEEPRCTTVMLTPFTIEDNSPMFLQNIKNNSPDDTLSYHSRIESQVWDF